jgi:hypothetical protein
MRNNYGGRRTARNPKAADVWGRVREKAFDVPADPPAVKLSETEQAREAYAAMGC